MGPKPARLVTLALAAMLLGQACHGTDELYPASATKALLETSDLGPGWKKGGFDPMAGSDESASTKDTTFSPCGRKVGPDPLSGAITQSDTQFNSAGRLLINGIGVFRTVKSAEVAMDRYHKAFDDCNEWTDSSNGSEISFKTTKIDVPSLGDGSAGHRVTGNISGGSGATKIAGAVIGEISLVRRLNVIATVAQLSIGIFGSKPRVDTADTIKALRAANEKLTKVKTRTGPLPSVQPTTRGALTATPTPVPTRTRANIGESLVLNGADGVKLSVALIKVVDPAQGQQFFEPTPGTRYVALQVRLGNVGTKLYDDSPGNGATLVDTTDSQHSENGAQIIAGPGFEGAVRLQPEDSRQGYFVFEVATEASPRLFQFTLDSGFGPQTAEWLLEQRAIAGGDARPA